MEPLESRLKAQARARGFALAGIAPATDADAFPHFSDWLDRGFAGEMNYLRRHRTERRHPLYAGVFSVGVVLLTYVLFTHALKTPLDAGIFGF